MLAKPEQSGQREVLQQAVEKVHCITFCQFRHVAKQRGWSIAWLVEQVKGEIDKPTDPCQGPCSSWLPGGRTARSTAGVDHLSPTSWALHQIDGEERVASVADIPYRKPPSDHGATVGSARTLIINLSTVQTTT